MQGRREAAGSVPRVPAPEIERLVIAALRNEIIGSSIDEPAPTDRELARQVRRVEVRVGSVLIELDPAAPLRR
jgi:hypothetical protein